MSIEKPFRVEVTVDAPRDEVWRALTEPERLRQWFGWEYEGLDEEIAYIVEHQRREPPERILYDPDGVIELEDLGDRTVVRAIKPGDLDAAEWRDVYGDLEEGWALFFNQLRYWYARHRGGVRRMTVLRDEAITPAAAIPPGSLWHETRWQRAVESDGQLVAVTAKAPLTSTDPAGAMLIVSTYDLDDEAFAAVQARWTSWWDSLPRS
jgi:uncharacterized protein YndB with AHSA1/START domain